MFTRKLKLFRLLGFDVKADASWILLAILVTWSLAEGAFPGQLKGLPASTYWTMGIIGAAGLFGSIILHELGHSLVARRCGIPIRGITLFIFGGVAEMEDEPPTARCEFVMAIAGPITSLLLAGLFRLSAAVGPSWGLAPPSIAVLSYLGWLNGVLALFNMVPAFPLDGGRVLRAALWAWKGNLRWATLIASQIGSGFGLFLIVMAAFTFMRGNFIGGVWWFMIGMFLRNASQMSYQHVLVRRMLEGQKLNRFMEPAPVTVPQSLSLHDLVEDYVYRHHFKMFPVVQDDQLVGCVTTRDIKEVPRDQWDDRHVADIMDKCAEVHTVTPDTDAMKALSIMNQTGSSRLLVVDDGRLVGVISLKDLLEFLALKMDLEGAA